MGVFHIQWFLYFKTTQGTKTMWSYIAGDLKIKVTEHRKMPFATKSSGLIIKEGLKIEGCKIEGLLYRYISSSYLAVIVNHLETKPRKNIRV